MGNELIDKMSEEDNCEVLPYQFEPVKKPRDKTKGAQNNDSDGEWEDVDEIEEVETSRDIMATDALEEKLNVLNRLEADLSAWCRCSNCKVMPMNRECLCCHEIDEIEQRKFSNGML